MNHDFSYECHTCGQVHHGMPSFAWDYPIEYLMVPKADRSTRAKLTPDTCVIDGDAYFVRGCVEIPVRDMNEPLVWGVWVSLSERSFAQYTAHYSGVESEPGPFFGWLTAVPPVYPDVLLKTMVHLRPAPMRPYIELEPTDHPMAVEQQEGVSCDRVQAIAQALLHGFPKEAPPN